MTRKRKSQRYLTEPAYGNCLILAPDGQALSRAGHDKIDWYLERNLGELVCEEPRTLKLFFEPSGRCGAEHPFTTAYKRNICVVCGSEDKITRHHVVPFCFRKHFPDELKNHKIHDVLLLCVPCHDKYEEFATEVKKQISVRTGIPIAGVGRNIDTTFYSVRSAAHALLNHGHKIPEARKQILYDRLKRYFDKESVTPEDIKFAASMEQQTYDPSYKTFGQCVVEQTGDVEAFIKEWRRHFVESMKPIYLPEHWNVDNPV